MNEESKTERKAGQAIIIGLLIAAFALIMAVVIALNTQKSLKQNDVNAVFARFGQIGDVMGGATGPILSAVGMLVVYYSLREQLRANNIQASTLETQLKKMITMILSNL